MLVELLSAAFLYYFDLYPSCCEVILIAEMCRRFVTCGQNCPRIRFFIPLRKIKLRWNFRMLNNIPGKK